MQNLLPNHPIILSNLNGVYPIEFGAYPDGQPVVDRSALDAALSWWKPDAMLLRTTRMDEFITAMFLIDALAERGIKVPHLVLPCVPGARQDRLNDEGDYLFTLKGIAQLVNARNFETVVVCDPHSDVTPALIDRCTALHPVDMLKLDVERMNEAGYVGVITPDGGAIKRAQGVASALGLPLIHGWKKRQLTDKSKLGGFGCEELPVYDGKYLVVDDLCDGGGTFLGLRGVIPEAQLDLYVTHGLFTKGLDILFREFETIITTDSVLRPVVEDERFIVLPVCRQLTERRVINT